jgi:hypothetical protein
VKIPVFGREKFRVDMGGYNETIEFSIADISDAILLGDAWMKQFRVGELNLDGPTRRVFIKKRGKHYALPQYSEKRGSGI